MKSDFTSFVAGQSNLTKFILVVLIVLFCAFFSFVGSYQGGGVAFPIFLETSYKGTFLLVGVITLIWLVSTVVWDWQKGISISAFSTVLIIILVQTLSYFKLLQLGSDFLITSIGNVIVQLAICGILFFASRFFIALIEILFFNSKFIKLFAASIVCLIAIPTSLLVFSVGLQRSEFISKEKLSSISAIDYLSLKTITLLGGLGLVLSLIAAAWITNRRRQVPWKYPDLIRELVLAVGSWRGTSFHNLNLSGVNFSGAQLANTDLRAQELCRTCFQNVVGLERARVDNQYLDLEYPKVQRLLTHGSSRDKDFRGFNLRGAYLQGADMRGFDLTDTNLTGADLKSTDLKNTDLRGSTLIRTQLAGADFQRVDLRKNILIDANLTETDLRNADLRDCILVRAQVARADFSGADLTGICIEDWSVSSKTNFTEVRCDYIYRRYRDGQRTDRYPVDRNFEPGEFASLFQQPENELELVFKGEEFDYTALSLTFEKLQTDKPDLKLKLQGIEQRQDLWVVKVTSDDPATVESRIKEIQNTVYQGYEVTTTRLENDPLIRKLISDVANAQKTLKETDEEVKQLAKRIGSNFYFVGGTITNVTGAGEIRYTEASNQVRSLVTGDGHETQVVNALLNQLRSSNVATTANEQTELIQLIILEEAQRDPRFRQSLLQQEKQILATLPESSIATAIQNAIAQLNNEGSGSIV